jgi:hypothetical protein
LFSHPLPGFVAAGRGQACAKAGPAYRAEAVRDCTSEFSVLVSRYSFRTDVGLLECTEKSTSDFTWQPIRALRMAPYGAQHACRTSIPQAAGLHLHVVRACVNRSKTTAAAAAALPPPIHMPLPKPVPSAYEQVPPPNNHMTPCVCIQNWRLLAGVATEASALRLRAGWSARSLETVTSQF